MVKKDYKSVQNKLCEPDMTFADCELAILRHAVDETERKQGVEKVNNPDVKKMLVIVEDFLRKRKLICYEKFTFFFNFATVSLFMFVEQLC